MSADVSNPDLQAAILEQQQFMDEEYVILVDTNDKVIGKDTKKATHDTEAIAKGLLHRAFSLLLFNSEGKLLLQQRAGVKITFPYFWANTCCSHPLYVESELIEENALGVKNAAIRKVEHELGIVGLNQEDITFTTKFHYEAAQDATWSEHEIDWIITAKKDLDYKINPNEVEAVRWVSMDELKEMIAEGDRNPDLHVAPWFRFMSETFLFKWWDRIDEILKNDGLPADLAEGLPAVTYAGAPKGATPASQFFPQNKD